MADRSVPNATGLTGWRKSSYSNEDGGDCLEVVDDHPSGIPVRDSKTPHGPALLLPCSAWSSFVRGVRSGTLRP
ncbi:DUF397 domain-containing protein [Streptomyces sp. MMS24-I2-30]|uniref:DUF397 domain-containing protein n=1 Tax=Streptomyces sp. MMS24-I2-30 TaxID=3351564 RepID=UPI003896B6A3